MKPNMAIIEPPTQVSSPGKPCPLHPGAHDEVCCPEKTIYTSKDQLWTYTHPFTRTDQVQIHSRGQFERECTKRNLRFMSRDELVYKGQPYHPEMPKLTTKEFEQKVDLKDLVQRSKSKTVVEADLHRRAQRQPQGGV